MIYPLFLFRLHFYLVKFTCEERQAEMEQMEKRKQGEGKR